jgi:hypothetical protein
VPTREQTTDPQDRACIRFYGEDGGTSLANLAVDIGQYETDLTVGAGTDCVYAASPATRLNIGVPRTIALQITTVTTTNSVLWNHGTSTERDRLRVEASNYEYAIGGTTAVITAPVPAGTSQIVVLRSESNPGTTGASDAVKATLEIYDVTNSVLTRYTVDHAARSLPTADFVFLAVASDGTNSYIDAGGECEAIRFSSRAVPFTEIAQDWIASLSDPTTSAKLQRQGMAVTEDSGIGDVAEFHGAAIQHCAAELKHTQWRTMGTLANWRFRNVSTYLESSHTATAGREKIMLAPGGNLGVPKYRLHLAWFGVFPVHPFANSLWAEIHVRCFNSTDADLRTFGFRVYSFNRIPIVGAADDEPGDGGEPLEYSYAQVTFTADEAAPGTWRMQKKLPIKVGQHGKTYVGLAYAHDLLDEGTESLQITVRAIHTVQFFDTTLGIPPGGGPTGEAG